MSEDTEHQWSGVKYQTHQYYTQPKEFRDVWIFDIEK